MKNLFGIMQGRLLPKYKGNFQAHPIDNWESEFNIASKIGFDCIEFILDYDQFEKNPLLSDQGIHKILEKINETGIKVVSICADFFMRSPIFLEDEKNRELNLKILKTVIRNSRKIGVSEIVIPLVDFSSIRKDNKKLHLASKFLQEAIKYINNDRQKICLETDLSPNEFLELINKVNSEKIKINYDIGNSVSLGYNFLEEFETYGHLVNDIHIKDRIYNGGSVFLGQGDAKFVNFFKFLKKYNYEGIFILQAYREDDDGVTSLIPQYHFINDVIKNNYI